MPMLVPVAVIHVTLGTPPLGAAYQQSGTQKTPNPTRSMALAQGCKLTPLARTDMPEQGDVFDVDLHRHIQLWGMRIPLHPACQPGASGKQLVKLEMHRLTRLKPKCPTAPNSHLT